MSGIRLDIRAGFSHLAGLEREDYSLVAIENFAAPQVRFDAHAEMSGPLRRLSRGLARYVVTKSVRARNERPLVTFTFDDIPAGRSVTVAIATRLPGQSILRIDNQAANSAIRDGRFVSQSQMCRRPATENIAAPRIRSAAAIVARAYEPIEFI